MSKQVMGETASDGRPLDRMERVRSSEGADNQIRDYVFFFLAPYLARP